MAVAKGNASVFAISKVMESDVAGFKAISDSLSLGSSIIAVASNASNQIGEILSEIKGKIVFSNEENVDRQKIQDEIVSLRSQISSIVNTAQFNGLNLITVPFAVATVKGTAAKGSTEPESSSPKDATDELLWAYQFEQMIAHARPSDPNDSTSESVDEVLAKYWS